MERRVSSLEWDRRSPLLPESLPGASVTTDALVATAAGATAAACVLRPDAFSRALAAAAAAAESVAACGTSAVAVQAQDWGGVTAGGLSGTRRVVAGPKATCRRSLYHSVQVQRSQETIQYCNAGVCQTCMP